MNRVIRRIRGSLYREFASKLYSGLIATDIQASFPQGEAGNLSDHKVDEFIRILQISVQTFAAFGTFIEENGIDISPQDIEDNRPVISNFLKQELLLLLVGDEASYKVAMDLDKQVQTAISRLPDAQTLLEKHLALIKKEVVDSL